MVVVVVAPSRVVVVAPAMVVVVVAPAIVVVVVAPSSVVVVVVGATQLQPTHSSPAGQSKAPDGELGSHSSPASTVPLPQVANVVVVVAPEMVVVVVDSQVHASVQGLQSGQTCAPEGELASHSS